MVELSPLVKKWVQFAENKRELAEVLLSRCHVLDENIKDDGNGCDCVLHRAWRTSAAEANADLRMKREMAITHQLALVQDSLRETLTRATSAEAARSAAEAAKQEFVTASNQTAAERDAAVQLGRELKQRCINQENTISEYKDLDAQLAEVLAKVDAARKALK